MTDPLPELPDDFGARLAAARAYYGRTTHKKDLSRDEFARHLNASGASGSTIKAWETGKRPDTLKATALIQRLIDLTGLPDEFFYGKQTTAIDQMVGVVTELGERVQQLAVDAEARDLEVHRRLDGIAAAIPQSPSQGRRQP